MVLTVHVFSIAAKVHPEHNVDEQLKCDVPGCKAVLKNHSSLYNHKLRHSMCKTTALCITTNSDTVRVKPQLHVQL